MIKDCSITPMDVSARLKARLFSAVEAGEERLPPFRSLAKEMELSEAVIRRALRELANDGLITMRQGSGIYVSDELKAARHTVAIVYRIASEASIRSPWHRQLLRDLNTQLERTGWIARNYTLSYGSEKRDEHVMDQLISDAENRKFTGIIVLTEFDKLRNGFRDLIVAQGIKYLSTNYFDSINAVLPDFFEFGYRSTAHLYERGVRRMALVGIRDRQGQPLGQDIGGMMAFVQSHRDIDLRPEWIQLVTPGISEGFDAFEKIWSAPERPEGLVVADEVVFLGVAMAMNQLKVAYPDDLQLIMLGTDGFSERNNIHPTRICFSPQCNANLMVALLQSMIRDGIAEVPVTRVGGVLRLEEDRPAVQDHEMKQSRMGPTLLTEA